MSSSESDSPTWVEARAEALLRLAEGLTDPPFYGCYEALLEAAADVVAASGGRDLVFLGRSPEALYDLLRALFCRTRGAPSLTLLPFSCRDHDRYTAFKIDPTHVVGLIDHLREAGLDPASLEGGEREVAIVDCVAWGTTVANFEDALSAMEILQEVESQAYRRRVHYVGLVRRSVGWSHWKHDAESGGRALFAEGRAQALPISRQLWRYLADLSPKTTLSHTHERWTKGPAFPELDERSARAALSAARLFRFGIAREVRQAFAAKLARRASDAPWLHRLVGRLLRSTRRNPSRR